VHRILGLITAKKKRAVDASRLLEARARFWDEVREGQREAEASCPKLDANRCENLNHGN